MQLQNARARFQKQGIGLAAISYDSEAILQDFAKRKHIEYSLLADPDSHVIKRFHVLNAKADGMTRGMAFPGYVFVDRNGVIREKFFESEYAYRFTANNVVANLFPELTEEAGKKIEAAHLGLALTQSDQTVIAGSRVSLFVEVTLPPDTHVYAPGAQGYKPVALVLQPSPDVQLEPPRYPSPKILYLDAIKEKVPVFERRFRIAEDVKIAATEALFKSLGSSGKTISVAGEFHYQACDQKMCYLPTSVPVSWQLHVVPLDVERSPAAIRHK